MEVFSSSFLSGLYDEVIKRIDRMNDKVLKDYQVKSVFLNKKSAAVYADTCVTTINKWIAMGLPVTKVSGSYRIDVRKLDKFMHEHEL